MDDPTTQNRNYKISNWTLKSEPRRETSATSGWFCQTPQRLQRAQSFEISRLEEESSWLAESNLRSRNFGFELSDRPFSNSLSLVKRESSPKSVWRVIPCQCIQPCQPEVAP